jgi:hypothetical protein
MATLPMGFGTAAQPCPLRPGTGWRIGVGDWHREALDKRILTRAE